MVFLTRKKYPIIVPFGLTQQTKRILIPIIFFIFVYSFNGHKELRFILYAIPMINIVAAVGMKKAIDIFKWKTLGHVTITGALLLNLSASTLFVGISSLNYPGGHAFRFWVSVIGKGFSEEE